MPRIRKRGDTIYADFTEVTNLTGKEIRVYDVNGTIVHIAPKTVEKIEKPNENMMFIVNSFDDVTTLGINPENIVVATPESPGRNMVPMSRLLRKDGSVAIFSPSCYINTPDEVYF